MQIQTVLRRVLRPCDFHRYFRHAILPEKRIDRFQEKRFLARHGLRDFRIHP